MCLRLVKFIMCMIKRVVVYNWVICMMIKIGRIELMLFCLLVFRISLESFGVGIVEI